MMRLNSLLLCAGLLFCGEVSAQWKVEVSWDGMTDRLDATAYTENDAGYSLRVYRSKDGSVRATVNMPGTVAYIMRSFDSELLAMYRIDRENPVDLADLAKSEPDSAPQTISSAIGWQIATTASWPPAGRLAKMVAGKSLLFRFETNDGESVETQFSLAGADRAIALAFDLMKR